ncbi:hypothetical protein [Hymenobacter bucti]|uniref:Uncharacterized protein n=1 Tax=Hymenobacter bucti TaxID=1844114 RepID=A0ABW4QV99_9BACT
MSFRPADRLASLLAEIITVLDRHTIQLQRLNTIISELVISETQKLIRLNELHQQCARYASTSRRVAQPGTELFERQQAQDKIKQRLELLLRQLS